MKRLRSGTGVPGPDETPPCMPHSWKKKAGGRPPEGGPAAFRSCAERDDRSSQIRGVKSNQRDVAVAAAGRVSPSAIHAFGSVWDCRFT
jgi:hypothetical protein